MMDAEAPPGPAPWESKEVLVGMVTLLTIGMQQLGVVLSTEEIAALGTVVMIVLRLFANRGPIDWARLTGR
ncbi:MAG: hypothetical protein A4E45_00050 [Methanosaeta sp. PtaB.Bin039]|nr:MAG: hypothetical protein A4E45_00050 [Methanosaeta sp. PtaB.Bin039]